MWEIMCFLKNQVTEIAGRGPTYMFKIAWAIKVTLTDRTDVVIIQVVEVFPASRIPDHPIAIIASLAYRSVLSRAMMFKQVVP